MMISQRNKQGWRNPWVLGLAAIILSGVLINGYLVWRVMINPVRLLDDAYSVKDHDKHDAKWVQQQAERASLGWQARLHSPQQVQNHRQTKESSVHMVLTGNPAKIVLELNDRDGKPVQGGQVVVTAQWPGGQSFDFSAVLYEAIPGHYEGSLNFPRAGNWDLLIDARQNNQPFQIAEKVFVAAAE